MRRLITLLAGLALAALAGCSAISTMDARTMTVDDIITMSKAEVGSGVIKQQIEATGSRFSLTTEDIVLLKKEGVSDDVLTAMIESGKQPDIFYHGQGLSPYDFWFNYYEMPYMGYASPYGYYGYGNPYIVYRQPGVIGRFYTYYPLYRNWNSPYDSRYAAPADSDSTRVHPGTARPFYPIR